MALGAYPIDVHHRRRRRPPSRSSVPILCPALPHRRAAGARQCAGRGPRPVGARRRAGDADGHGGGAGCRHCCRPARRRRSHVRNSIPRPCAKSCRTPGAASSRGNAAAAGRVLDDAERGDTRRCAGRIPSASRRRRCGLSAGPGRPRPRVPPTSSPAGSTCLGSQVNTSSEAPSLEKKSPTPWRPL